jgi:pimeloyl-ACP methyl ester carboxylesterase
VLLHGFPDSARLWRHQVATLADAGFQVIVCRSAGPTSSATPPPPAEPRSSERSPGTCCSSSFPVSPSAGLPTTTGQTSVTGSWRYERLDGPGHWMQLDAPGQVNALLLDFLTR